MPELSGMIQEFLEGSIKSIGGKQPVIQSKTITENGTYNVPSGIDGFNPVVVNVPSQEPNIQERVFASNGTFNPPEGVDGYAPVIIDVPMKEEITLNATMNGTYTPSEGRVYNNVVVNVPVNCNMYSSNDDKLRLYENVFNGISILSFNGLYINQTMAFNDIENEHVKSVLNNLTTNPISRVFNSNSQAVSNNQLTVDASAKLFRYYSSDLASYDVGYVFGSVVLINIDLIAGQYPIQVCPNIS